VLYRPRFVGNSEPVTAPPVAVIGPPGPADTFTAALDRAGLSFVRYDDQLAELHIERIFTTPRCLESSPSASSAWTGGSITAR
jgi:hypothetical protein